MAMYVQITKTEFDTFARTFNLKVTPAEAGEFCYERPLGDGLLLRVWSSIMTTSGVARRKGSDAMRVQIVATDGTIVSFVGKAARVDGWQKRMTKLCTAAVSGSPAARRQLLELKDAKARQGSLACPTCKGPVKAVVGRKCGVCFVCSGKPRCKKGGWLPSNSGAEKAPEPTTCETIPSWWAELIEAPGRFDGLDKRCLEFKIEGDELILSGGATFRCRKLLRQFGLDWKSESATWRGPKRKLEERKALKSLLSSAGLTVAKG